MYAFVAPFFSVYSLALKSTDGGLKRGKISAISDTIEKALFQTKLGGSKRSLSTCEIHTLGCK